MSPRRKTERDVPETDGRNGRLRRMSLRREAETDGPETDVPVTVASRWMSPRRRKSEAKPLRRMSPRQRMSEAEAPETYVS